MLLYRTFGVPRISVFIYLSRELGISYKVYVKVIFVCGQEFGIIFQQHFFTEDASFIYKCRVLLSLFYFPIKKNCIALSAKLLQIVLSTVFIIPQRWVMAVMGFLAVANAYTMRVCLNIAITQMVRQRSHASGEEGGCPVPNVNDTHTVASPVS